MSQSHDGPAVTPNSQQPTANSAPQVSIIIPVLNDTPALQRCLAALSGTALAHETIVADGGRDAGAVVACSDAGAVYVSSPPGRAVQMNAGAARARGEWLWFLHADCTAACGSADAIAALDSHTDWGCFAHRIDAPGLALRIIERADNWRARLARLPYGDQGIFVRREVFQELGGFAHVPILEDLLLARALKRRGAPRILPLTLKSDARRWVRDGVFRTTMTHWRVLWKFYVRGASLDEIAAFYRRRTRGSGESPRASAAVIEKS